MAEAVTATVHSGKCIDFAPEEIASAVNIAAKLAFLSRENLIFVDGFISGAIMAQSKAEDNAPAQN